MKTCKILARDRVFAIGLCRGVSDNFTAACSCTNEHFSLSRFGMADYGHDAGGSRYSPATQINRDNVAQLKVAWTYRTGALDQIEHDLKEHAAFEATPLLVDGRLYLSTPLDHVIALEPETGKKIWEYDPKLDTSHGFSEVTSRGVSAWKDSAAKAGQPCRAEDIYWDAGCAIDRAGWRDG